MNHRDPPEEPGEDATDEQWAQYEHDDQQYQRDECPEEHYMDPTDPDYESFD